jgi:DnaJ-class molecular chaperone
MPDYYAILGVSSSASKTDIRRSYLAWAKIIHPDKHRTDDAHQSIEDATRSFNDIKTAYDTLYDTEKRKEYDLKLLAGQSDDCCTEASCMLLSSIVYDLYALYRQ